MTDTTVPNGVSKERMEEHGMSVMAGRRANSEPLPGPMAEAFAGGSIKVGEYRIRKVVASDWVAFKQIKSPVLEMILDLQQGAGNPEYKPSEMEFSDQQQWELVWQFLKTPKEVRKAIADGTISALAESEIGDAVEQPTVMLLIAAVMEQLKRSWQTAVKYGAEAEKSGDITFFRDTEAMRKMASDGGSSTSAGS